MNEVLIPSITTPATPPIGRVVAQPRRSRRVLLRPILGTVMLVVVAVFLWRAGRTIDWRVTWSTLQTVNPLWYGLALAAFWITFMVRTTRWRVLLGNARILPPAAGESVGFGTITLAMLRAWFLNAVTVGQLGDAYRAMTIANRAKARVTRIVGTILAERVSEVVILTVMLVPALISVFGKHLPISSFEMWAMIAAILVAGPTALLTGPHILVVASGRLPERIAHHVHDLAAGIEECLRPPFRVIACSILVWSGETVTLFLVGRSIGVHLTIPQAAAIALMTALLTAIPITPAGIGIAESGMVLMFSGIGLPLGTATALTILARSITFGSLVIFGGIGWLPALILRRSPSAALEPGIAD
ncbi:MAG: lysylphosphatidylglycerol synthase transmembrane domain-containing protein [Thermomicrobiales bacterium]